MSALCHKRTSCRAAGDHGHGHGDDERRRAASERGAADFVTKPVDFDNLMRQLQQLAPARAKLRPSGVDDALPHGLRRLTSWSSPSMPDGAWVQS